ncbi:hypothetical protein FRC01_003643, partial [Tulasnella sp. 417]
SVLKYAHDGAIKNRRAFCLKIKKQQLWIIQRSYDPKCKICHQDPTHAEAHAINNISYVLSSCEGFMRIRDRGWVLSGRPIVLKSLAEMNAHQEGPQPNDGKKKGRPRIEPQETHVKHAAKAVSVEAKVPSAPQRQSEVRFGMTTFSGPGENLQINEPITPPQAEQLPTAPYPGQSGKSNSVMAPHLGPDLSVEYTGDLQPGNPIDWMAPPYLGPAQPVDDAWTFQVYSPVDPMSSLYFNPDPFLNYTWSH